VGMEAGDPVLQERDETWQSGIQALPAQRSHCAQGVLAQLFFLHKYK
jgi:hypothetical protein